MSEGKTEKEKAALIKSQALKILDCLVKIAPISSGIQETWKVGRETEKVLTISGNVSDLGELYSTDSNLNLLKSISCQLSNELGTLNRKDENWWIETSGANLFSNGDSTKAIEILNRQRKLLLDLKEGCRALKTLASVLFANTVSNVKGLAKLYMPSLPIIDATVTNEIREELDVCDGLLTSILKKLDTATCAVADMNKAVDRLHTLLNSQNQQEALKGLQPQKAPAQATQ